MSKSEPSAASYGNWDMLSLSRTLRGKAAYFLQRFSWNGAKISIKDNKNLMKMTNSPQVITMYEIQIRKDLV
ncbi:MAG: hypothetical protein WBB27_18525 [Maribacter sp.]